MKLIDIIEVFIAGDWGEETYSKETPCAVTCVRGADIIPISEYDFSAIPVRYINQQAYAKKCLQVGDIIIEKSGGSPTQSTGRVSLVSQELLDHAGAVICSNFCTAFRVKKGWIPLYVYYYLQFIYNLGAFFNFEGKTSGIKNLQLDAAFAAIPIEDISETSFTLRAKNNVPNDFFYGMLRSNEIQLKSDKAAMGSTLRCLVMDSLQSLQYVKVPEKIMCAFSAKVSPLYRQINQNNKEIAELTKQRNELLPLLMNGQVSVNSDLSLD